MDERIVRRIPFDPDSPIGQYIQAVVPMKEDDTMDEDMESKAAFDAAWEHQEPEQCPNCGHMLDSWNRCATCEPEQYEEQEPEQASRLRFTRSRAKGSGVIGSGSANGNLASATQ